MKLKITIVLFFIVGFIKAQDTSLLRKNVLQLNEALITNDTLTLMSLLHPKVKFGHSNGWVQAYKDVFLDSRSEKLQYIKIENQVTNMHCTKKWAIVTSVGDFEGKVNDNIFKVKLHVMQTWLKEKNKWKLISRQSTKL